MKKLFLTASFALATILCSAQFMAVTTINMPEDDAEWEMSNITDNMGIGYQLNDEMTIGAVKNGEDYDLFCRYNVADVYVLLQAPSEESMDNLTVGVGYSFNIWNNLYIEPNYTMPVEQDSGGDREGEFKLGIAYRF
jgi:opacity protein-like surface antigen